MITSHSDSRSPERQEHQEHQERHRDQTTQEVLEPGQSSLQINRESVTTIQDSAQDSTQDSTQDPAQGSTQGLPQSLNQESHEIELATLDLAELDLNNTVTASKTGTASSSSIASPRDSNQALNHLTGSRTMDDPQRSLLQMSATQLASSPPGDASSLPDWSSLIGRQLGGCRVDRILGAGGMGVVFEGTHLTLSTKVAIKCLPPHQAPSTRDRFALEARVAAQFSHPNIVQVLHAGEERGLNFIVMELVRGESVADKLKRRGALSIKESLEYCLDVCRALTYAERQGIVHRDIKPANILVNQDGKAKLADLGLVKLLDHDVFGPDHSASDAGAPHLTGQGSAVGTPHYIAPEQIKDAQSVDHRADIYALGCTLFHMLCGEPPFNSRDVYKLFTFHLSAPRPQASDINPNIPRELSRLLEEMMAIEPQERPSNSRVLEQKILSLVDEWSTQSTPIPIQLSQRHQRERLTHHMRNLNQAHKKTRWLVWGITLLGGALFITLIWVFTLMEQESDVGPDAQHSSTERVIDTSQLNTLLWIADQARHQSTQMAQMALSGRLRLIAQPKRATDHYWNAQVLRSDRKLVEASGELWLAFSKGLQQYDLIEQLGSNLTETLGPVAALHTMRAYQQELDHSGLKLWVQTRALKMARSLPKSIATPNNALEVFEPLINEEPPYMPALGQLLKWLDTEEAQRAIPLFERVELKLKYMKLIEEMLELERLPQLKLFYLSLEHADAFTSGLKSALAERARLEKIHKLSINVISTVMPYQKLLLNIMPLPEIYREVSDFKYHVIDHDQPLAAHLSKLTRVTQAMLRAQLAQVKFKSKLNNYYYGNLPVIDLTLDPEYQGIVALEVTDLMGLKSYAIYHADVAQERLKALKSLHHSRDWYQHRSSSTNISFIRHPAAGEHVYFYNIQLLNTFAEMIAAMRFQILAEEQVIFESAAQRESLSDFKSALFIDLTPHQPQSLTVKLTLTLNNQGVVEIEAPFHKLIINPKTP